MKPTGGQPITTPIAPPAPLFPGITGGFGGAAGGALGRAGATSLSNIMSGQNLGALFSSIQKANQYQSNIDIGNLKESFGSSGMGESSGMMKAITDYQLQNQKQLTSQFAQLGLQNESMQLGADQTLMQLATAFAPTQVVGQAPSGNSIFSQVSSAGESAAMMYLMYAMLPAAGCWIAHSFYGPGIRFEVCRNWLLYTSPRWFKKFYLHYGERISKTPLRWLFRPLFEYVLLKEAPCLNTVV